jgi:drug/metabolite transporter (DMT)-like permease
MRASGLGLGTLTLAILALLQGRSLRIPNLRTWGHIGMASLFNIISFSIFTSFAQLDAETSRVAILVYTMPIWAALMAWPVLGERLTMITALALVLCCVGLAVLISPLATHGVPIGILLSLGAALGWAAGTVYFKWAKPQGEPVAITTYQLLVGFCVLAATLPMVEGVPHLWGVSAKAILALLFSGVIGSGIAYFLWFEIVRRLSATTASLGVLSAPVVGVIASIFLLGEHPTWTDIIGFALMFAASACVLMQPHAAPRSSS